MNNDYRWLAPFYDLLSQMVFGRKLDRAQTIFFDDIPEGSRILWIGGGTGRVLPQLLARKPSRVVYLEKSGEMLARAQRRVSGQEVIQWVEGTENDITGQRFDVVLSFFFFDQFGEREAYQLFQKLDGSLDPGGVWLWADFREETTWYNRLLLSFMQYFFAWSTGLRNRKLPPVSVFFQKEGYQLVRENQWQSGFIAAVLQRKIKK